jgi:hypothetical protein
MTVDALPPSGPRTIEASMPKLVQLPSGEYTALSVVPNFSEAAKLGLVKAQDGNYVRPPIIPSPAYASLQSTSGVQAALTTLPLGGP